MRNEVPTNDHGRSNPDPIGGVIWRSQAVATVPPARSPAVRFAFCDAAIALPASPAGSSPHRRSRPWPSGRGGPANDAGMCPGIFCREARHVVARVFGVLAADICRPNRCCGKIARARQVAMYLANVGGGISLTQVGHHFGRDRSTVAHACALVEDLRDDPALDLALTLIEQALRAAVRLRHPGQRPHPRSCH